MVVHRRHRDAAASPHLIKESNSLSSLLCILTSTLLFGAINCEPQIAETVVVDQCGRGQFRTVQAAIDSIKKNNDQWVKVSIKAGTYNEKVEIPIDKPWVFLEGAGKDVTTITYGQPQVKGGNWEATFISSAPNVLVSGITFENSYNLGGGRNPAMKQASAAAIHGDKSVFYKCGFLSVQDTLYDQKGRHYFKECYIQGEVDFICGSGQSYYEDCRMNVTQRNRGGTGFVTAQYRESAEDPSGFVFDGGSIEGCDGKAYLGRAWGPYSRVIFHGTYFGSLILPQGWDAWTAKGHERNTVYAEVNCKGPGSDTKERAQWVKKLSSLAMIDKFSLSYFIDKEGWTDQLPICF